MVDLKTKIGKEKKGVEKVVLSRRKYWFWVCSFSREPDPLLFGDMLRWYDTGQARQIFRRGDYVDH